MMQDLLKHAKYMNQPVSMMAAKTRNQLSEHRDYDRILHRMIAKGLHDKGQLGTVPTLTGEEKESMISVIYRSISPAYEP